MTLSEAKGHFCCFKPLSCLTTVCLHNKWKAHVACDLNFIVKDEGLLIVTVSHIYWKSGNISATVPGKDVVTTGH